MVNEDWKNKRTANIDSIELLNQQGVHDKYGAKIPPHADGKSLVTIGFKFPCKWTTLTIQELLDILKLWIIAEEERYPFLKERNSPKNDFFFKEIEKVFEDHGKENKNEYTNR